MKARTIIWLLALCLFQPCGAWSQSLKDAELASKAGNWKVLRSQDPMNDQIICTGIFEDNYSVQLSAEALYLTIPGGVQSLTLRFDENPPRQLRLATDMEKRIRSVILKGNEFSEFTSSKRLRYQVSTLVRGIESGDMNLEGLGSALESIKAGCPKTSLTSPDPIINKTKSSECSPALVERMRKSGVSEAQVKEICN